MIPLNLTSVAVQPTSILEFVSMGLCATFLGFLISLLYCKVQRQGNAEMFLTLTVVSLIAAMVCLLIGNNIAHAIAIISALSVVRFRNAVKSPLDACLLLSSLVTGLACGSGRPELAVLGLCLLSSIFLILHFSPWSARLNDRTLYRLRIEATRESEIFAQLESLMSGTGVSLLNVVSNDPHGAKDYLLSVPNRRKSALALELAKLGETKELSMLTEAYF